MLRGAFGGSLRRAVCTTRNTDCPDCLLQATCPFPLLFMGKRVPLGINGQESTIPPYCIEPPAQSQRVYDKGSIISFGLILFSYATTYLPYFIHAFSLMGERGLGKNIGKRSGTFMVESVRQGENANYDPHKIVLAPWQPETLVVPQSIADTTSTQETLHLNLVTPLRFKQHNALSTDISFAQVFLLCLRRAKALWALEEKDFVLDSFPACMELARTVVTEDCRVQWCDVTRYSGRQASVMQFGGLVGQVVYTGLARPFMPFLAFAAATHLGKQTSFGLGKVAYTLE